MQVKGTGLCSSMRHCLDQRRLCRIPVNQSFEYFAVLWTNGCGTVSDTSIALRDARYNGFRLPSIVYRTKLTMEIGNKLKALFTSLKTADHGRYTFHLKFTTVSQSLPLRKRHPLCGCAALQSPIASALRLRGLVQHVLSSHGSFRDLSAG